MRSPLDKAALQEKLRAALREHQKVMARGGADGTVTPLAVGYDIQRQIRKKS